MTAQPAPKTQELANKINLLFSKKRRPSPFDIRLLKRDAEKLKGKIDYFDYWDFLGQISSLENSKNDIIYYCENAIKLAPDNYDIQYNYLVCLENRGLFSQAMKQAKILVDKFPNELEVLTSFVNNACRLFKFKEVIQFIDKLEDSAEFYSYKTIVEAISIFENARLSDDEAQYLCQLAFHVLEIQNLYYSGAGIKIVDNCVCYTIYVDSPIENMFDINWELAGIFAENVENMRCDVLMFEYSSIDVLEEKENYERSI